MSPPNTIELCQIFQDIDQNGDGQLTVQELNLYFQKVGTPIHLSPDAVKSILAGKSSLTFEEFVLFHDVITKQLQEEKDVTGNLEEDVLIEVFKEFDLNKDGFISCCELRSVLTKLGLWDDNEVNMDSKNMIHKYDINSDGLVDFQEFKRMMLGEEGIN